MSRVFKNSLREVSMPLFSSAGWWDSFATSQLSEVDLCSRGLVPWQLFYTGSRGAFSASRARAWHSVTMVGPGCKQGGEAGGESCASGRHDAAAYAVHALLFSPSLCWCLQRPWKICQVSFGNFQSVYFCCFYCPLLRLLLLTCIIILVLSACMIQQASCHLWLHSSIWFFFKISVAIFGIELGVF